IPGTVMSPTNFALPVTLSTPSTRGTLCPTYLSCRFAMPFPNQKLFIDPNKAVPGVQEIDQRCEITFSSAINLSMRFTAKLIRGTLVQRYKRFLADVRLADGAIVTAHCTNTGSMRGYKTIRREVKVGRHSRLDLCLDGRDGCCYVEVKNVTACIDGAAAFPDAVSERDTKHLKELIRLKRKGQRAVILFVVQRRDCEYFRPA